MEVAFNAGLLYKTAYAMRIKSNYPIYTFIVTPLDVVKIRLQAQQTPFHRGKTTSSSVVLAHTWLMKHSLFLTAACECHVIMTLY